MQKDIFYKIRILNKKILNQYIFSLLIIGVIILLCAQIFGEQNYYVVSFILLFAVSLLALIMKVGPILFIATLSAVLWNFFFIPPHYTFHIDKTEDILIFCMFFIIVMINGVLTSRIRAQEGLVRERERKTNVLFQLTNKLIKANGIEEIVKIAKDEIQKHFEFEAILYYQDGNNKLIGDVNNEKNINSNIQKTAEFTFHSESLNDFNNAENVNIKFIVLKWSKIKPGVIGIPKDAWQLLKNNTFWDTFINQISMALERELLEKLAQKVKFLDESDRLYKTLFNSISHEFRIPVATIMGASDSLISINYAEEDKSILYQEIFTASLRLNRLVENLLNMSRLESGLISLRLDWYDMNDLLNQVMDDLKEELKNNTCVVVLQNNLPLVKIDFGLMEQVLYNLLLNATQYTPPASVIKINVFQFNNNLQIEIIDQGEGFSNEALENLFNKFFRNNTTKSGGLGLGLSIVKGFIESHKGTIKVENLRTGGAKFILSIPSELPTIDNFQIS